MKLALKAKDCGPDRAFASALDIINFERRGIRFAQASPRG